MVYWAAEAHGWSHGKRCVCALCASGRRRRRVRTRKGGCCIEGGKVRPSYPPLLMDAVLEGRVEAAADREVSGACLAGESRPFCSRYRECRRAEAEWEER